MRRGLQCLDQAYIEPQQNVSNRGFIFLGKSKKNHVIQDIFVVNRDKKITIHDKKITNRDFFLR